MRESPKPPAVIITGLPWLRTGTGKVMEAQVEFFRSIGWKVIFVACPHTSRQGYNHPVWNQFEQQSSDLKADHVFVATFPSHLSKGGAVGKAYRRWTKKNAMHWAMEPGTKATIPVALTDILKTHDVRLLLANHIYTLSLAKRLRAKVRQFNIPPLVLVTHDVQSHILQDNSVVNPFSRQPDPLLALVDTELQALRTADYLVHVSEADQRFFKKYLPNMPQRVAFPTAPDRVNLVYPMPADRFSDFLFVGSNHVGNLDAVNWLFESVTPLFRKNFSIRIVGTIEQLVRDRSKELYKKFSNFFVGAVDDPLMHYLTSHCVMIPMVSGRGVSIKTIEACSLGRPIVGTPLAFRGLPMEAVRTAGLQIYETPFDFAQAAVSALETPARFREASAKLYYSLFSKEAFRSSMQSVLTDLKVRY